MPSLQTEWTQRVERLNQWFNGLPIWLRLMIAVGLAVVGLQLIMAAAVVGFAALLIGGLALFAWIWFDELIWLMRQEDHVFPGRFDKLIWAFLLIFLPPVGVLGLGSFRRARMAERTAANGKPARAAFQEWE